MSTRAVYESAAVGSLRELAEHASGIASRGLASDDWMVAANAASALALRELAEGAAIELSDARQQNPTIEDLKVPLLAAVGAADLALALVNDIVATLRERAGEARSDAEVRVEESRATLTKLQVELPSQLSDLTDLRKLAESYADAAQATYNKLIARGEIALERLRSEPTQTHPVGGRGAKLVGVEIPKAAPVGKVTSGKLRNRRVSAKKVAGKKAPKEV